MAMNRPRNYKGISNDNSRLTMVDDTNFGPHKTLLILAIVGGCFAVLWPKIFYPMLVGPSNSIKYATDDSVCCDLIFESDVNTVDILQEMCKNILKHHQIDPRVRDAVNVNKLSTQSASFCREEVLARCGIDLSSFLAEKERLGKTNKQVLEEIRSFNSSICLKVHFGVPLSQLGIPHLIRYHILMPHTPIKQERTLPPHAGGLHPAMRERGRAIPTSHIVPNIGDRPEHMMAPKMRPPMGGSGRVVPPPGGTGSPGIFMPIYTIFIVGFFVYTVAKLLRKNSNSEIYQEYIHEDAEREFRDRVFNPEVLTSAVTGRPYYPQERSQTPVRRVPTVDELRQQAAGDIEVDQLIQRLADTEAAMERIVVQMGNLSRTVKQNPSPQPDIQGEYMDKNCYGVEGNINEESNELSPTVKVLGMEMTASCEGGQKISRPSTPIISSHPQSNTEHETPPKPIYLEGALPSQCELLVTDSETQAENNQEDADAAVVLSGKMTLSLISLDQIPAYSEETSGDIDGEMAGITPENSVEVFDTQNPDNKLVQEDNERKIVVDSESEDEEEEEEQEDNDDDDNDDDEKEEEVVEEDIMVSEEKPEEMKMVNLRNKENLENKEEKDSDMSDESDEGDELIDEKNIQIHVENKVKKINDENVEDEIDEEEEDEDESEDESEDEGESESEGEDEDEDEEEEGGETDVDNNHENSDEESPKSRQ